MPQKNKALIETVLETNNNRFQNVHMYKYSKTQTTRKISNGPCKDSTALCKNFNACKHRATKTCHPPIAIKRRGNRQSSHTCECCLSTPTTYKEFFDVRMTLYTLQKGHGFTFPSDVKGESQPSVSPNRKKR